MKLEMNANEVPPAVGWEGKGSLTPQIEDQGQGFGSPAPSFQGQLQEA